MRTFLVQQTKVRKEFMLLLTAFAVGAYGIVVLASSLFDELAIRNGSRVSDVAIDIPLLAGISLIYLSTLLRRRKRTAWGVTILLYAFILGFNAMQLIQRTEIRHVVPLLIVRSIVVPLLIVSALAIYHNEYVVKSDIRNFGASLQFVALIILIALVYGVGGFLLLDNRDFHQEISFANAIHRTIDQFGLTTTSNLVPHTRRAKLFLDSLSFISVSALVYAVISFFQPLRARYSDQAAMRQTTERLLEGGLGKSEDFFKLWPHDKVYFLSAKEDTALAYKVQRGVALVVGDPVAPKRQASALIKDFEELCFTNDWLPAFIHTESHWSKTYERAGYSLQKIGEEAVLDIAHFEDETRRNKYFRHISNKFEKQGFTSELLLPPHSEALISRLQEISDDWLELPGRTERGFMMGHFSEDYLQLGPLMVARDSAGTIQAFLNQIPSFDPEEANFDFLRHTEKSPGNINDFVLLGLITHLHEKGIARLNLGLCPLAGMESVEDKTLIDNSLQFLYSNGDRLYSFRGLYRFKAKYEPVWSNRYIAYKGGLRGLTRTANALNRAMKIH